MPILPLIGAGVGLAQSIIGGIRARKSEKALEGMQTPTYGGSSSIMDYYNKALQRFNTNPYQSQGYQAATNAANRSMASGLNALQGRGSAVAGVSRLVGQSNDAAMRAGTIAEQQQNQRFNELGQASEMKTGDELRQFQQNQIAPFEKKYNLLSMKAGAGNQMMNAGLSNIFGGLGAMQDYRNIKKYGSSTSDSTGGY